MNTEAPAPARGFPQFTLNSAGDLVNPQANKCVDIKDNNANAGAKLQLWDCAGTSNQKWASA